MCLLRLGESALRLPVFCPVIVKTCIFLNGTRLPLPRTAARILKELITSSN